MAADNERAENRIAGQDAFSLTPDRAPHVSPDTIPSGSWPSAHPHLVVTTRNIGRRRTAPVRLAHAAQKQTAHLLVQMGGCVAVRFYGGTSPEG